MVWHRWQPTASPNGLLPPVVLLHGGSGSWSHWLRTIDPLRASGRPVLAADLPGFGDSDPPPRGGDADALVAPLAQGLAQLVPGTAVDLVGFSFGGLAAALLAVAHPARVRSSFWWARRPWVCRGGRCWICGHGVTCPMPLHVTRYIATICPP